MSLTFTSGRPESLTATRPEPVAPHVASRLRSWVRCVLDLPEDTAVHVTKRHCRDAGCAPLETVLAVLRPGRPLARTLPIPAAQICAADIVSAFDSRAPRSTP